LGYPVDNSTPAVAGVHHDGIPIRLAATVVPHAIQTADADGEDVGGAEKVGRPIASEALLATDLVHLNVDLGLAVVGVGGDDSAPGGLVVTETVAVEAGCVKVYLLPVDIGELVAPPARVLVFVLGMCQSALPRGEEEKKKKEKTYVQAPSMSQFVGIVWHHVSHAHVHHVAQKHARSPFAWIVLHALAWHHADVGPHAAYLVSGIADKQDLGAGISEVAMVGVAPCIVVVKQPELEPDASASPELIGLTKLRS